MPTGLYGIEHSNRTTDAHWGKTALTQVFPQLWLVTCSIITFQRFTIN